MINIYFNERAKALGCKWDGRDWVAPELAKDELKELKRIYFDNLRACEVKSSNFSHKRSFYAQIHFAGYVIAQAASRDSGAKLINDVAVIEGGFTSGGSQKHFTCEQEADTTVRLFITEEALNRYIKIIDSRAESEDDKFANRFQFKFLDKKEEIKAEDQIVTEYYSDEQILEAMRIISTTSKERRETLIKIHKERREKRNAHE